MSDPYDDKWHWEMERWKQEMTNTMEAIRQLPTQVAINSAAVTRVEKSQDQLHDKLDSVDSRCQERFDTLDEGQRRSKRDLLIALAAFAAPIVVAILGYIFTGGHP